ncbi:hypothetical protein DRW42_02845 [Pedobacter miscanthi]|uniref:Uncharacterized protein n=1 Tax=Pedobacter miscanthi TaxID=2259170 RepID=A0A366LEK2_9SPHI|nr:hypothetical protein DRW42_02845 [Pedobacter miscanthi]
MQVTYFILLFTGLFLLGTYIHYRYTVKKGIAFRYKPLVLLIVIILFFVALYGSITQKPYNEILPFIG